MGRRFGQYDTDCVQAPTGDGPENIDSRSPGLFLGRGGSGIELAREVYYLTFAGRQRRSGVRWGADTCDQTPERVAAITRVPGP